MKIVDLHAHTTASDGSYTPTELVRYAKKKGLSAIAMRNIAEQATCGGGGFYRRQEAGDPGNPGSGAQHSHGRL